jgi:hypothetical protein
VKLVRYLGCGHAFPGCLRVAWAVR